MRSLAKTFAVAPSAAKWTAYQQHFAPFFEGRDPQFDGIISFITDFRHRFGMLPNFEAFARELTDANELDLLNYLQGAAADPAIPVYGDDTGFVAAVDSLRTHYHDLDIEDAIRAYKASRASGSGGIKEEDRAKALTQFVGRLHKAGNRLKFGGASTRLTLHGEAAKKRISERWSAIQERKAKDENLYYAIPYRGLDDVYLRTGDLLFTCAFTKQGKSILLRNLSYHFAVEYGLNVAFWSREIPADEVELMFALMHANNKKVFPGTPKITYKEWVSGTMSEEKSDFLINVAWPDLIENESYGTLYIEFPEGNFTLEDLSQRHSEIEHSMMRMHVSVVDYMTLMDAVPEGNRRPDDKVDVNTMIKRYRQLLLNHRNEDGELSPIIGMSAAQISRGKYAEALKNDGLYDGTAPSDYNEIERSSAVVLTSILTPEMAAQSLIQVQCVLNRFGRTPPQPTRLFCDFGCGMGLSEVTEQSPDEVAAQLQSIDL